MEIPGPPLSLASWLSPQTVPTATPPLATPACHCNTEVGPKMTLPQMPGCYYYIIPGNTPEPGSTNATAPAPGPTPAPNPGPATAPSHLQPRDTHGGNPNLHRATRFGEQAPVSLPPSAPLPSMFQSEAVLTCKSVVFWMEVSTIISKLAAGGWERLQHTQLYKNPSLEDMINACAKVGTGSHNMDMLANTIMAAVKQTPHCFKCGQQGHIVGEDETRKPYKYDCLDFENMKPISEIELKASFDV
ncbi:hypothetical protein DUI87_02592 [Hirundo rustica rustica]|uniref:Uncharacterized protein n=1 Tax=Hirundo rustica rustica TaxID=333673 RepID=A0A3M0L8T8_HIRRU|nr:hypothetical protein DUI87_02592 [Hirundo rustica rustica]